MQQDFIEALCEQGTSYLNGSSRQTFRLRGCCLGTSPYSCTDSREIVFFEAQEEEGMLGVACCFQQVVSAESGRKMS